MPCPTVKIATTILEEYEKADVQAFNSVKSSFPVVWEDECGCCLQIDEFLTLTLYDQNGWSLYFQRELKVSDEWLKIIYTPTHGGDISLLMYISQQNQCEETSLRFWPSGEGVYKTCDIFNPNGFDHVKVITSVEKIPGSYLIRFSPELDLKLDISQYFKDHPDLLTLFSDNPFVKC